MVLVLDDHPIARQGLESIIKLHKPEEETVQAGTVKEAIDLAREKSIDSVFVDLNLHNESGFDFLEWIQNQNHDKNKNIKTFVITSSSSEIDFMKAKNMDLMANVGNTSDEEKKIDTLTRRELEVALLLREGYSNAKLANILSISEGTVKKHISNIFSKLEIYTRTEVLVFVEKHIERFQLALNSLEMNQRF